MMGMGILLDILLRNEGMRRQLEQKVAETRAQRDINLRHAIRDGYLFKDRSTDHEQQNCEKPKIMRAAGYWVCVGAGSQGYGFTPSSAYESWNWRKGGLGGALGMGIAACR
jgi:hypothetical protein